MTRSCYLIQQLFTSLGGIPFMGDMKPIGEAPPERQRSLSYYGGCWKKSGESELLGSGNKDKSQLPWRMGAGVCKDKQEFALFSLAWSAYLWKRGQVAQERLFGWLPLEEEMPEQGPSPGGEGVPTSTIQNSWNDLIYWYQFIMFSCCSLFM